MEEIWTRLVQDMIDRVSGPMNFRLVMQPLMATIFAVRDGLGDAKHGRQPYFWSLLRGVKNRGDLIRSGWKSIGKVFVLALILDAVYQFIVSRYVYPGEAIIVAFLLAVVPYPAVRGLVARLARKR